MYQELAIVSMYTETDLTKLCSHVIVYVKLNEYMIYVQVCWGAHTATPIVAPEGIPSHICSSGNGRMSRRNVRGFLARMVTVAYR